MKPLLILFSFFLLGAAARSCKEPKSLPPGCYLGRLEIKGVCMNYTISIQSKNADTSLTLARWTDENTGKTYKNVFGLASRCHFPDSLKAGDEFYFTIDSTSVQNCLVCLAYYPTPARKLFIKVHNAPCSQP